MYTYVIILCRSSDDPLSAEIPHSERQAGEGLQTVRTWSMNTKSRAWSKIICPTCVPFPCMSVYVVRVGISFTSYQTLGIFLRNFLCIYQYIIISDIRNFPPEFPLYIPVYIYIYIYIYAEDHTQRCWTTVDSEPFLGGIGLGNEAGRDNWGIKFKFIQLC